MKFLKDLGLRKAGGRNRRFGLYLCPVCEEAIEIRKDSFKFRKPKMCRTCADKQPTTLRHGHCTSHTVTRLYNSWAALRNRCNNMSNKNYNTYGGRGISVCIAWEDFVQFEKWALANGYSEELTIDRIDNNGNYEPDNCRWATRSEQQNNRGGYSL